MSALLATLARRCWILGADPGPHSAPAKDLGRKAIGIEIIGGVSLDQPGAEQGFSRLRRAEDYEKEQAAIATACPSAVGAPAHKTGKPRNQGPCTVSKSLVKISGILTWPGTSLATSAESIPWLELIVTAWLAICFSEFS